jgi:hypothetical protein
MSTYPVPPLIPGSMNLQSLEVSKAKITSIIGDVMSTLNSWKGSVTAASTSNLPTLSGSLVVDGVTLVAGDTVLLKNQITGSENGIYLVNSTMWTRNENLIEGSNAAGVAVFVNEGSSNTDTIWACTNDEASAIVGTDSLTFSTLTSLVGGAAGSDTQVQFNSSGVFAADVGLTYNSGTGSLTATGAVQGLSLTDGVAAMSLGAISGATSIGCNSLTATGAVQGLSLTDGAFSSTAGTVTGIVDLTASNSLNTVFLNTAAMTATGNCILGSIPSNVVGFFGAGPVSQQTTGGGTATITVGTVGPVFSDTKFNGYDIGQVILALQSYGILA